MKGNCTMEDSYKSISITWVNGSKATIINVCSYNVNEGCLILGVHDKDSIQERVYPLVNIIETIIEDM